MDKRYSVTLEGIHVGEVMVEPQGLYYHITCCSKPPRKEIYTLCADGEALGILVPDGEIFKLETRIPRKRLADKVFSFCLAAKNEKQNTQWIPISSGEPFAYLHQLKGARFSVTEQGPAIGLPITNAHP